MNYQLIFNNDDFFAINLWMISPQNASSWLASIIISKRQKYKNIKSETSNLHENDYDKRKKTSSTS